MTNSEKQTTLFIVAGDPSADHHAADVVNAMKQLNPSIRWVGVGGPNMNQAGVELISDQSIMGKVGLYGLGTILKHHRLGKIILNWLKENRPPIVLHVDYGGFNLWLAGQCKNSRFHTQWGMKNIHYIPPQVWASRKNRLKTIKRVMDWVFCIFPFEKPIYDEKKIPVTFVGHPLIGNLPPSSDRNSFCQEYSLDASRPIIALLPGSRSSELHYLLKPALFGLYQLNQQREKAGLPALQVILPKASLFSDEDIEKALSITALPSSSMTLKLVETSERHALLSIADAGVIKSGTSTLEATLYKLPQVIIYRGHPLAAWLARKLCYLKSWGLPNVLTTPDNPPVPELLQEACTPERIAQSVSELLDTQSPPHKRVMAAYATIANEMTYGNAAQRVAQELLAQLR